MNKLIVVKLKKDLKINNWIKAKQQTSLGFNKI